MFTKMIIIRTKFYVIYIFTCFIFIWTRITLPRFQYVWTVMTAQKQDLSLGLKSCFHVLHCLFFPRIFLYEPLYVGDLFFNISWLCLFQLLTLWESKNHYFDGDIISKLKEPQTSWTDYKSALMASHSSIVETISAATKATLHNYQSQHEAFVNHALQQIQVSFRDYWSNIYL